MSEMESIEVLFRQEFARLVRSFSVAFGVEQATGRGPGGLHRCRQSL